MSAPDPIGKFFEDVANCIAQSRKIEAGLLKAVRHLSEEVRDLREKVLKLQERKK